MSDFLDRNAKLFAIILLLIVTGVATVQFFQNKFGTLSAWKGGGFGMYTEPPVRRRTIWLTFQNGDQETKLRVGPATPKFNRFIEASPERQQKLIALMLQPVASGGIYPKEKLGIHMTEVASHIQWPDGLTGGVLPLEGGKFSQSQLGVEVWEVQHDISEKIMTQKLIFDFQGGE